MYRFMNKCRGVVLAMALTAHTVTASSQVFQNLDFESIGGPQIPPDSIWLNWSLAAPGWTHPLGGDSVFVYHNTPPLDSIAQYYFLIDSTCSVWSPLQGNFSLALVSGHYNRNDASSPWVSAYIEQTGLVPGDAQTLKLMARGDFSLFIDSAEVPVIMLADDQFAADISKYAGQTVSLRIENEAIQVQQPVFVDGLQFLAQPIPEPGSASLLVLGLAGAVLLRRRSRP
jgi:hypothetical protein